MGGDGNVHRSPHPLFFFPTLADPSVLSISVFVRDPVPLERAGVCVVDRASEINSLVRALYRGMSAQYIPVYLPAVP